jgi:hypothetical protein
MEIIEKFAKEHRLKVTKDSCGDDVVVGRLYPRDANISEFGGGMLAMCWLTWESRKAKFNSVKRECLEAGMTLHQEGDDEGIFLFDPSNSKQATLAISSVKAKVKKQVSEATKARLVATLANARQRKIEERV